MGNIDQTDTVPVYELTVIDIASCTDSEEAYDNPEDTFASFTCLYETKMDAVLDAIAHLEKSIRVYCRMHDDELIPSVSNIIQRHRSANVLYTQLEDYRKTSFEGPKFRLRVLEEFCYWHDICRIKISFYGGE